jgi:hypothetical protein
MDMRLGLQANITEKYFLFSVMFLPVGCLVSKSYYAFTIKLPVRTLISPKHYTL